MPGALLERHVFAEYGPRPGSFSDYLFVFEAQTGEVVEGSLTEQTRACLGNLQRRLEEAGSSLEQVVWASWALRDPGDFDSFSIEWARWFPGDSPVGQLTLMPPLQRRAGFRISIGVIAEA